MPTPRYLYDIKHEDLSMVGLIMGWLRANPKIVGMGVMALGVLAWGSWTAHLVKENRALETGNLYLQQDVARLLGDLEGYIYLWENRDKMFEDLDQEQVNLLCEARYIDNRPVPRPAEPATIEVIKYIDRVTGCPTEDQSQAEQVDRETTHYRPVDEGIALGSVNNAWKAYCIATNNEDPSCIR